jgi:hypothetical protein
VKFHTVSQLGPTQHMTAEGFLVCEAVPINRIGTMIYGPGETPVSVGADGIARIQREAEEVFRAETIASFNGKPVVNEHPDQDVTPTNWRQLAVGIVMDPRRGTAALEDTLLADFLITDQDTIEAIRSGSKREVSCGYDADYDELGPGLGRQKNIIGNHVALVDTGRCGPRCAIGDSSYQPEEEPMFGWKKKLKDAAASSDKSALSAVLDELPDELESKTHVHVHTHDAKEDEDEDEDDKKKKTNDAMDSRLTKVEDAVRQIAADVKSIKDASEKEDEEEEEKKKKEKERTEDNEKIEGNLEMEAPPGTGDRAYKAKDSAYLEDAFQATIAAAEIIAPGVQFPTFDKKAQPGKTYDSICQFRRRVLDLALAQPETRTFLDEITGGREMKKMTCDAIRSTFFATATFKKRANNITAHVEDSGTGVGGGMGIKGTIKSPADLNKMMAERYK